jgi:hypothetical protein
MISPSVRTETEISIISWDEIFNTYAWKGSGFDPQHSLVHSFQTGSGSNPGSCPVGTGDSFLGTEVPGHEADSSHPSSAEVMHSWRYTCTLFDRCSHVIFMLKSVDSEIFLNQFPRPKQHLRDPLMGKLY